MYNVPSYQNHPLIVSVLFPRENRNRGIYSQARYEVQYQPPNLPYERHSK